MDQAERSELRALHGSLVLTVFYTAAAFAIALASDSETMTLEAMSGLVDVVVSLLAIFVARKVREPANERYHFGYAKYESLMIGVEGTLIATVCLTAIAYAVKDLVHPDPVEASWLVIVYSAAGFVLSVGFGIYMRRLGRRAASPLVAAEAELWLIDGWLSLGVCAAFVAGLVLSRSSRVDYSAYVDPVVCIALSLMLLRKPFEILKESLLALVDANPYAETRNAIEQEATACVTRYGLSGVQWVHLRKAGRRLFVLVSFFAGGEQSLRALDGLRDRITEDLARLNPELDVSVLFRSARG
jgi:cation diffusion facilitator family transporter